MGGEHPVDTLAMKKSRRGNAEIDRAVEQVLKHSEADTRSTSSASGYDERQHWSPGFNSPSAACRARRSPTIRSTTRRLTISTWCGQSHLPTRMCLQISKGWSTTADTQISNPKGEPQLGKRGLYDSVGWRSDARAFCWQCCGLLNLSDGGLYLLDIALRGPAVCRHSRRRGCAHARRSLGRQLGSRVARAKTM